jgi:ABC-2 type transport system permease protein
LDRTENGDIDKILKFVLRRVIEMEIIKLGKDWAKAEVFSAGIIWIFSVIEITAAIGFCYWGKTAIAKAFIWPLLIAGLFLTLVGAALYFRNHPRIPRFKNENRPDPAALVQKTIQQTAESRKEMALLFKILPAIILLAALIILLFPHFLWRAIAITAIITAAFLMVVDSNTEGRNNTYNTQLSSFKL